ncbi:MAG: 4Fe-4S dicluster domain-containing protein [Peptococcaceae bacterium]|nr:4Fe-4S dicluster domain-containing protein [Peptococcaceae bacterium]
MAVSNNERKYGRHIIQYPADVSLCAGCGTCEAVCGLIHDGVTSPSIKRIFLVRDTIMTEDMHKVYTCQQCLDHPCYNACPRKDSAMCIDEETGIVYINEEHCNGCRRCWKACPFEPKRIAFNLDKPRKALKCDLCRNRPEGPACVEFCQVRCIGLSDQPIPGEGENNG